MIFLFLFGIWLLSTLISIPFMIVIGPGASIIVFLIIFISLVILFDSSDKHKWKRYHRPLPKPPK